MCEAVFWYNMAPKVGTDSSTVPSSMVHSYKWRHPMRQNEVRASDGGGWCVGDRVLVKPKDALCTSRWRIGRVSKVVSTNNVEVDGVPRHVLDIRSAPLEAGDETRNGDGGWRPGGRRGVEGGHIREDSDEERSGEDGESDGGERGEEDVAADRDGYGEPPPGGRSGSIGPQDGWTIM